MGLEAQRPPVVSGATHLPPLGLWIHVCFLLGYTAPDTGL